jgi:2-polyprenyl-6-methoxyphenol hydroxylase-like FAD-dependent oxidoreductase
MASELARYGIPVRIVDRNPSPTQESRAVAIQARTLEVFAGMGLVHRILEAGHRIHGVNLSAEGHRILHFSFDELPSPFPFAIDLAQSVTERLLAAHLCNFGVQVERPLEITGLEPADSGVIVHTPAGDLWASYVIGCDGAHSAVRHAAGIPVEGDSGNENFILADVPVQWDGADDEWHLWFHEDGLFTMFPLAGGLYRLIAEVGPADSPATAAEIRTVFAERGPRHATLGDPVWISRFQITHRKASSFRQDRVFLAGDAAHVHSPAGGQGMNTGIQDAYNLAWKLAMVIRGDAPDSLLDSYTAEREPVARSVLALTGNLNAIATLRHPISQKIRNRLIPILASFDIVEHRLVERLAEIGINYRGSPIVGESGKWYAAGPMPGDRALDADLGGKPLFDILHGSRHAVLLFAAEHPEAEDMRAFANIHRYMHDGYKDQIDTWLIARREVPWSGSMLLDPDGHAHHAYAAGVPCVYLVRPDGYVGFRSLTPDPLPLLEFLNRIFEPPVPKS